MTSHSDVAWKEDGTPYSQKFDDIYFSKGSGPAEVEHVFIEPNKIGDRLTSTSRFVIGELGFGTGLNFLMTWDLLSQLKVEAELHFYSVEKYPMSPNQFSKAYENWTTLSPISNQLKDKLNLSSGWNLMSFNNIVLHLYVGDVVEYLKSIHEQKQLIHAWYLDGFAPSKNPEMWTAEVLKWIGQLSDEGTTFSTYTAVGRIRRDLIENGFEVTKLPGFGKKREMLYGVKL